MKKRCWMIGLVCLVLLLIFVGCGKQSDGFKDSTVDNEFGSKTSVEVTGEAPDSFTLMVYMVGSDLEAATAAATNDMAEMEESGVNLSKVKLLVYTGGSPKWHNDSVEIPTDSNAVFELTKDGFVQVTDFEAQSMGESSSLSRFLQYGYDNYKSEAYGLILWDHGNGPVMGYGSDLQYGKDALTLPEIEAALEASPFSAEEKLEFIGFDACLMSSVELACMVDDYAGYLIASQEVEPGFGWNYQFLKKCCKVDTRSLVQEIVDQYISYSEEYFAQNEFFQSEVTLSVMNLSYAKDLETSIDSLFGKAAEDVSGSFNQLALERVETRAFGRATTGSEYDLVDLQALMDSMSGSYEEETKAVQDILQEMVVYSDSNTADSCGLSLYYPYYNKKYYEASWKNSYAELGLLPNYITYLERYGQIWLGTDMKEYFSGKLVAQEGSSGSYTLQLTEDQNSVYADSGYYIFRKMGEDVYSVIYYSQDVTNEEGLLTANFDGRIIYYGDETGFKGIPITRALDEVDGQMRYAVFPTLTGSVSEFLNAETMMCRMVLSVDPESGEITVLDFSESTSDEIQTGKRPQVDLSEWVRIQFFEIRGRYLTRDADGRIVDYWEWPESDWILGQELSLADGLQFTYEPVYDDGNEYFLMFDIMDVQGNRYSSELYPITLEEAPEEEEVPPTDAGTLEEDSLMVFDREGVKLYLDLVKDSTIGRTSFFFRAENSNDYSIRINIEDLEINDSIQCSESIGYLTVAPGMREYDYISDIELNCMLEQVDIPEQLGFRIRMYNEVNDKTLINDEEFVVHFADSAEGKLTFLKYMGALAEEQMLLDEKDGMQVKLIGAGYYLNRGNSYSYNEGGTVTGILRIENVSEEAKTIQIGSVIVNGIDMGNEAFFWDSDDELTLQPGQVYYHTWELSESSLLDAGITEITSIANVLDGNAVEIVLTQE